MYKYTITLDCGYKYEKYTPDKLKINLGTQAECYICNRMYFVKTIEVEKPNLQVPLTYTPS